MASAFEDTKQSVGVAFIPGNLKASQTLRFLGPLSENRSMKNSIWYMAPRESGKATRHQITGTFQLWMLYQDRNQ